jgi:hypothetical protein
VKGLCGFINPIDCCGNLVCVVLSKTASSFDACCSFLLALLSDVDV